MEVPRLGVTLELQLPAYTTATATQDTRHMYGLHYSSWQHWILNPLSETRGRTHNLMVPSWIPFCCAKMGTPKIICSYSVKKKMPLYFDMCSVVVLTILFLPIHEHSISFHLSMSSSFLSAMSYSLGGARDTATPVS